MGTHPHNADGKGQEDTETGHHSGEEEVAAAGAAGEGLEEGSEDHHENEDVEQTEEDVEEEVGVQGRAHKVVEPRDYQYYP